ncbi:MAG: hypothetical protein IJD22_01800 [Clostridia bacterium]|nr:hypothetical protein [Clostridia bacterium]
MQDQQGTGFLRIQAVSAGGALPVQGATVLVTDRGGESVASLRTDSSGLTPTLSLPAPPRALSQSPANGSVIPYSTYTVQIRRDGFYSVDDYSVPVFDGITAIQVANMIPLSEFSPLPPNPLPQRVETPGYDNLRNNESNTSGGEEK